MWNTEVGWRIVDDTLQIKGGRGYETADSLRSRGERPDPVERMMRDFRINLIFEGSSEIMRLFIAREAVDTHLKVAGPLIDPKSTGGQKMAALVKSAGFYGLWYPKLWIPFKGWFGYGEFGPLAGHVRFVERSSRKLARTLFHCMIRFGPKLEKRQAVLGRLVEIGAELLAISASASRAHAMVRKNPADRTPLELADLFGRQARRRVAEKIRRGLRQRRRGDLRHRAEGARWPDWVAGGWDCEGGVGRADGGRADGAADGRTGGRADGRTGGRADGRTARTGGRADGRTGGPQRSEARSVCPGTEYFRSSCSPAVQAGSALPGQRPSGACDTRRPCLQASPLIRSMCSQPSCLPAPTCTRLHASRGQA